jgi:hypothetical protein
VLNALDGTVSVLGQKLNGTLAARIDTPVGTGASGLAIADLNGDGKLDMVGVNGTGDSVNVFIGHGDRTFAAPAAYPFAGSGAAAARALASDVGGTSALGIAIGDLDGDGKMDLAVANTVFNVVAVLIGHGDGTFGAPVDYGAGSEPLAISIGDLDGDGMADLAVVNFNSGAVSVLSGTGGGHFGADVEFGTGLHPRSAAMGDLDGDGRLDLVVADDDAASISILHNPGCATLGVGDGPGANGFGRLRTYPNPSSTEVRIQFSLPSARAVQADIFDVAGRKLASPVRGTVLPAGPHEVHWNFKTDDGRRLPEGLYLVRIRAGNEVQTGSVLQVR